jgi:hypothetical protein
MTNFVFTENPKCLDAGSRLTGVEENSFSFEKVFGKHLASVARNMWKDSTAESRVTFYEGGERESMHLALDLVQW